MKKLRKIEKVLIIILIIAYICGISTINYATSTGDVNDILPIPEVEGSGTTKPTPTPTSGNLSGVQDNNNNTSLPKTGVNDTAMWIAIGVSAVAAIYAYKKVKDYTI